MVRSNLVTFIFIHSREKASSKERKANERGGRGEEKEEKEEEKTHEEGETTSFAS